MLKNKKPRTITRRKIDQEKISAIIRQRNGLRTSLMDIVRACRAASEAAAFADGKMAYRNEILKACQKGSELAQEDFPERPQFKLSDIPRVRKGYSYKCSLRWFCKKFVAYFMEYRVGETRTDAEHVKFSNALERLKYIALESIGYGHESYDEEELLEMHYKSEEGSEATEKHSLKWFAAELVRLLQDFDFHNLSRMHWAEMDVLKECSDALCLGCLKTCGIDIGDTEEVFAFLAEKDAKGDFKEIRKGKTK